MNPYKILIVDDEENILWVLKKGLEKNNYIVDTATSGEKALEQLQKNKYLMMFSDIFMEGISGLELMEQSLRICPELKIVMMTAQDSMNNTIEAMRLGAYDYLSKPFDFDDVYKLLAKAEAADWRGVTIQTAQVELFVSSFIHLTSLRIHLTRFRPKF